jgi:hypothetical protein
MNKALRLLGAGVLVVLANRVLYLLLEPALPLLLTLFALGLLIYIAIVGRRGL